MKNALLLCFSICLCVASGCGGDQTPVPELSKIEIKSSNGTKLDLNTTTKLTASGVDQFGKVYDISGSLNWSSDNNNISIDQDGNVVALLVGSTVVTAEAKGKSKTLTLRVWDSTAPRIELYVSDAVDFNSGPFKILKYDQDGKNPEVFIADNLSWPQDILFLKFNDQEFVLVSNLKSGMINRHNSTTGAYIDTFASGLDGPTRMKIGPDGLLYVLQWQGGDERVLRFQLDGTALGPFTSMAVPQSIGLDWDSSGNLYVSSFSGGSVRKFDTSGNDLGLFISSNLQGPTNIWFNSSGDLYANDWSGGAIRIFSSSGSFIADFATGISQVEGVAFLDNGDILVGVGATATVKEYSSSGTFVKDLVTSGLGGLIKPNVVVVRKVNF